MHAELTVARADLRKALKLLQRGKAHDAEAVVWFESDSLFIDLGGVTASAPAVGRWHGRARVPGAYLTKVLARSLPMGDPLLVRYGEDRFFVGGSSVSATWQDLGWDPIEMPINPPLSLLLSLPHNYTEHEIENSGLTEAVRKAEVRRDTMITKAAAILTPLDVPATDLRRLVDDLVSRKHKRRPKE